jgi:hypothetical protein
LLGVNDTCKCGKDDVHIRADVEPVHDDVVARVDDGGDVGRRMYVTETINEACPADAAGKHNGLYGRCDDIMCVLH